MYEKYFSIFSKSVNIRDCWNNCYNVDAHSFLLAESIKKLIVDAHNRDYVAAYSVICIVKNKPDVYKDSLLVQFEMIEVLKKGLEHDDPVSLFFFFMNRSDCNAPIDELKIILNRYEGCQYDLQSTYLFATGVMKDVIQERLTDSVEKNKYMQEAISDLEQSFLLGNLFSAASLITLHKKNKHFDKADMILKKCPKFINSDIDNYFVANILKNGTFGTTEDLFRLVTKLESENRTGGSYLMGYLYINGISVTKDLDLAIKYFRKGIRENDSDAMFSLGQLYLSGDVGLKTGFFGKKPDYESGILLIEAAASKNNISAIFRLGYLKYTGQYAKQNKIEGIKLLKIAAASGSKHAVEFIRKIS